MLPRFSSVSLTLRLQLRRRRISYPMPAPISRHSFLLKSAVASRLLLLILIVFWRSLVNPYDTSASLNPSCLPDSSSSQFLDDSPLFPRLGGAIERSIVWDSVYYVRIAQCGYEYEQTYAFFPLLPICISILARTVLFPLVPVIGYRAVLGLSGYLINNVAFVFAAVYLYKLSIIILKDSEAAHRASLLFCFNPASIFYSSIYSESLYALFSVGGVFHLLLGSENIAAFWFALSGLSRSNGMVNAGYICFQAMHRLYEAMFVRKQPCLVMKVLALGALRCICIFLPFVAFQALGYYNICFGRPADDLSPWCTAKLPIMYNYIQNHYWGVGFLLYFHVKQLPNFMLASPILSLALCSVVSYATSRPKLLFSLGFQASSEEKSADTLYSLEVVPKSMASKFQKSKVLRNAENQTIRQRKQMGKGLDPSTLSAPYELPPNRPYLSPSALPFILHLGFMAATAFFVMHVQVATRFLSASAPLYWFASDLMVYPGSGKKWGYTIWAYCAAYILLGSLLFSNFYPFT